MVANRNICFFILITTCLLQAQVSIQVDPSDINTPKDSFTNTQIQAKAKRMEEAIATDGPKAKVEVIIDSSGSMGQILAKNKTKMYYLKELMKDFFRARWKEKNIMAMRVYGGKKKGKCDDIRLAVPFGKTNIDQMERQVAALSPMGMTPLHTSLTMAFEDIKTYQGPKRIVVVTDGQDTCGGDPCKTAEEYKKQKMDLKFYVIALGFKGQSESLKKISCIGDTSVVNDGESFGQALNQIGKSINQKDNLQVISPNPTAVVHLFKFEGNERKPFRIFYADSSQAVPPGDYEVVVDLKPAYRFGRFTIPANRKITLSVVGDGNVRVNYFNKLVNVELLDKNNKAVAKFRSDEYASVPTGKWRLRAFKDPFYEMIFPEFFVYPDGKHEFDINGVGAFKVDGPQMVGVYVYDQENKELGQILSGFTSIIKSGTYTVHVNDKCSFPMTQVFDRKEILVLPCSK